MGQPEWCESFSFPPTLCLHVTRATLTVQMHLSHLSSVQSVHTILVTWAHLLFQDLPDLEDVDSGESLEDQDKVIPQVFPQ